jgi:hypothetical protein
MRKRSQKQQHDRPCGYVEVKSEASLWHKVDASSSGVFQRFCRTNATVFGRVVREKLSLQEKLLEHHETELCSPSHRFGPTVRIELSENGGDVKLSGVEGDPQPTCDGFVGDAVCHRSKYFELAGG